MRSSGTRWVAILWIAAIANVLPLFVAEYLPFTDLPEHLAVMSSLRHWSDPVFRVQEHYALAVGQSQYLLYPFAGTLLSYVVGSVELANRLLLAGVGLAFPFTFRMLLRATGRDERLALFACPLFWSRPLIVGFLPFVASIPLLLAILALHARALHTPSRPRRGRVWLACLAVVLFFVHVSAFVMLVLSASSMSLVAHLPRERWRAFVSAARETVWVTPAALVATVWWALGRLGLEAEMASQRTVARMAFGRTVRAFALWAHDAWWSHTDEACAVVFWLAFIALLLLGLKRDREQPRARDLTFLPFLCAGALYLLLPFQVGAGYMLNVRMAPLLALFAVLAVRPARGRLADVALYAVFASSLVTAANSAREIHLAQRDELGDAGRLVDRIRPGARLLSLSFRLSSSHTHFPPWLYLGSYHRVRKGGLAAYSFTEMTHWPLHYVPENAPPKPKLPIWVFQPCLFRNAVDGPYYDYVLVRGELDPFRDRPPGPVFTAIGRAKDFTLYEKVPSEIAGPWPSEDLGPCASRPPAAVSGEPDYEGGASDERD